MLNTLIDKSDPDVSSIPLEAIPRLDLPFQTSMSQIEHLLQTAEAIRRDGKPEWMQVRLYLRSNLHYLPDCYCHFRSQASCTTKENYSCRLVLKVN